MSDSATTKERFELLLAATVRQQERFVDVGFKIAASLTVVLGWLLTAESAQLFLKGAPVSLWSACVVVGTTGSIVILVAFAQAKRQADITFARLAELQYVPAADLTQYRLKSGQFWGVMLLVGTMCALIVGGMLVVRANA
jgi:hypothetical protein